MVSILPASCLRSNNDLLRVRRLLRWQAMEYDGWIWCGTIPLADQQRNEIVLFTSYILAGLVFLTSSFFLMLLENYDLQLHHLTSHSLMSVTIFIHLYEMYVVVRPSVHLFRFFFTLQSSTRSPNHLGAYYF
jgi:hypothetical protein